MDQGWEGLIVMSSVFFRYFDNKSIKVIFFHIWEKPKNVSSHTIEYNQLSHSCFCVSH